MGRDRVIGAWRRGATVIDPGPASTVEAVSGALRRAGVELEAVLLTHIHLDHAAGAGALIEEFPGSRVYVHEIGAPHIVDPSRLWASAARLYGPERMRELWGEPLPVPEQRVRVLSGGERIGPFEVIATPGHAAHHVVYLDLEDGSAYAGDVAGVRIPPSPLTLMPTPPPEIDVEAWLRSIDALRERAPSRLRLTHFGEVEQVPDQLESAEQALRDAAALAERDDRERFLAALEARIDGQPAEEAERMRAAMPPEQLWLGLERYWRKSRAGD